MAVIIVDSKNAMSVFNVIVPVIAAWVGTVLAIYFGRENFESANKEVRETNQQVRDLVQQLTPEERAKTSVVAIMRPMTQVTSYQIQQGEDDKDVPLKKLRDLFKDPVSRLPILDPDGKLKYMIHQSSIDKYIADGGSEKDSLETFIAKEKAAKREYGANKGFIMISQKATLADAKRQAQEAGGCQDIFVTVEGKPDEIPLGWISNVRMAKFLQA
ncbi:MAG: CBS domain-containing protein [Acidobacteriota bacterium]